MVVSVHVVRCSILVSGIITIYLNILRTSAIIFPMVQFKKRYLNISLIIFISTFVLLEASFGTFYSYPVIQYVNKMHSETELTIPYSADHPLHSVLAYSLLVAGVPLWLKYYLQLVLIIDQNRAQWRSMQIASILHGMGMNTFFYKCHIKINCLIKWFLFFGVNLS